MGAIRVQLVRSVRPPLHGEAELDEAVVSGGRRWAAEGELRRLQRARLALHRVARLCGHHFGPALLLSVLQHAVQMVSLTYNVVLLAQSDRDPTHQTRAATFSLCLFVLAITVSLLAMCWLCSSAANLADTVGELLGKLQILLRRGITSDVLCLSIKRMNFSAAGFFDIDLSLFIATIGTTITYVIILIQFKP
ncbi:putative gustatory receptor 2a [Schistocerca piceifrons]|uniref:putative gustatory receptor 2a n=1 Tax=Schistocerca piceifrons TaxID=274613 RepID=UPI001F5ED44C|nr:putative gustatory receptor 2a [Schistocerca piceifrons]